MVIVAVLFAITTLFANKTVWTRKSAHRDDPPKPALKPSPSALHCHTVQCKPPNRPQKRPSHPTSGKRPHMLDWLVVDTVTGEPVSASNSLLTGKITGKSEKMCEFWAACWRFTRDFGSFLQNSLRIRTGNYLTRSATNCENWAMPQGNIQARLCRLFNLSAE